MLIKLNEEWRFERDSAAEGLRIEYLSMLGSFCSFLWDLDDVTMTFDLLDIKCQCFIILSCWLSVSNVCDLQ